MPGQEPPASGITDAEISAAYCGCEILSHIQLFEFAGEVEYLSLDAAFDLKVTANIGAPFTCREPFTSRLSQMETLRTPDIPLPAIINEL